MSILSPTKIVGRVVSTLVNPEREKTLESVPRDYVEATFAGLQGDSHAGLTRESCVRVKHQYVAGTEIRNTRQVSILSAEDLAEVASRMGLQEVNPGWVGANLLISGIPSLTLLPPSARLIFSSGASLVVDMENGPCVFPARVIDQYHPDKGKTFPKAALNRRGVTAWVEREGRISPNDEVALHLPPQRTYPI
jgi:MOSC domain-containing protein YiiM